MNKKLHLTNKEKEIKHQFQQLLKNIKTKLTANKILQSQVSIFLSYKQSILAFERKAFRWFLEASGTSCQFQEIIITIH